MNFNKFTFIFLAFALILLLSCNNNTKDSENNEIKKDTLTILKVADTIKNTETKNDTIILKSNKDEKDVKNTKKVFKFICPLGDKEGSSDKEGVCPVCEMELIENPDYTK